MMAGGMAAPPPPPAMGAMPEADTVPVAAAVLDPVEDAAAAGVPMGDAGGVQPKSPVVHGTYEAAEVEEEEEVMVKTEFVWADGAEHDVKLSGAWNGWMPVQMYHEGGGMWSVVTPVPAGTHEFKFVVDGEWKHSTRHPTVGDDEETMNNVRVIRGHRSRAHRQTWRRRGLGRGLEGADAAARAEERVLHHLVGSGR
eukprot:TRINITY_DN155_c0_g1_i5.p3 TRINITY_DN155_c0_g1~~TRINITY_DN155_c0_g1_i5.p3  ORF type:complete len:197 (-),score=71.17 TRINITY_DN155_c0_g1_i5:148-738(-)